MFIYTECVQQNTIIDTIIEGFFWFIHLLGIIPLYNIYFPIFLLHSFLLYHLKMMHLVQLFFPYFCFFLFLIILLFTFLLYFSIVLNYFFHFLIMKLRFYLYLLSGRDNCSSAVLRNIQLNNLGPMKKAMAIPGANHYT